MRILSAPIITWAATVIALALALAVGRARGFDVILDGFLLQGVFLLVICPIAFALYGALRPMAMLVAPFHAFAQFAAFNGAVWFLQFPLASLALPSIDGPLVRFEEMLGADWPDHFRWMISHPTLSEAMGWIYRSLLFQVPLACAILGFCDPRRLNVLVLANTFGLSATVAIATIFPAGGGFYVHTSPPYAVDFVAQFDAVREGTLRLLDPETISGIISFPSYHTILAVLIGLSFRGLPRVFPFVLMFEAAIIFTTRGIGGHHYADIAAGVLVALFANWAATRLVAYLEERPLQIRANIREAARAG